MSQPRLNDHGIMWDASIRQLSLAYGVSEAAISQRVYAIAEQVHRHYCMSRGIVNHMEARPDQHVAVSILGALAGADWWLVREADRRPRTETLPDGTVVSTDDTYAFVEGGSWAREAGGPWEFTPRVPEPPTGFVHFGDDTVNEGWAATDDTP